MRILHTADWHLGHVLHGQPRAEEQQAFLDWLLDELQRRKVDALLISGDLFDGHSPPVAAQQQWYGFLARATSSLPHLRVVAVAGNHDSGARLEAVHELLRLLRVHVVGVLPRDAEQSTDCARLVVPLPDASGVVRAVVAALPYLRPADLPPAGHEAQPAEDDGAALAGGNDAAAARDDGAADELVSGLRRAYASAIDAARRARRPGQALLVVGHLYVRGGRLSQDSERPLQLGGLAAVPADLFPDDVAYVALGHLHLAQRVAGREALRYAGSPLPLALSEAAYPHQVLVVELDGDSVSSIEAVRVPRAVDILCLPATGYGTPEEVLAQIDALPPDPDPRRTDPDRRPFLEVRVRPTRPEPTLRARVEQAVGGKNARFVRLTLAPSGDNDGDLLAAAAPDLGETEPETVFRKQWGQRFDGEPPAELLAAFRTLLEEVQRGERA